MKRPRNRGFPDKRSAVVRGLVAPHDLGLFWHSPPANDLLAALKDLEIKLPEEI